jgi:hypothetical protein
VDDPLDFYLSAVLSAGMNCSLSGEASGYLDVLYDEYHRFDVQQTTVGVNPEEFAALDDHTEGISVRVRIEGEDGVLARPDGNDWTLPGGVLETDPVPGAVVDLVERQTGIRCSIDGLERISIVCLQCDVVDEDVWTLSALFAATPIEGTPRRGLVWRDAPLDPAPVVSFS